MKKLLKGIVLGVSAIIPGFCSASMAIITGLYTEIIEFSSSIWKIKNWLKYYKMILGICFGILLSIFVFTYFYNNYTAYTYALFIGINFMGIILLIKQENKQINLLYIISGFILVLIFTLAFDKIKVDLNYEILYFIGGIVVAIGFLLPGISGSLLLMAFGMYFPLMSIIKNTLTLISKLKFPSFSDVLIISIFMIGFVIGLIICSKVIKKFLNEKTKNFMQLAIGMIIASFLVLIKDFITILKNYQYSIILLIIIIILGVLTYLICFLISKNKN